MSTTVPEVPVSTVPHQVKAALAWGGTLGTNQLRKLPATVAEGALPL